VGHYRRAGVGAAVLVATITAGSASPAVADTAPQGQARRVAVLTGAGSVNATDTRYDIKGTDLWIMWSEERGRILVAFGDTFGAGWTGTGNSAPPGGPAVIDWRSNTLASSRSHHPAQGMALEFVTDRPGHARELLASLKQDGVEISKIPTGGIHVDGRDYLAYMSVRHFGQPGHWITNYSGIAYSDDNGRNWTEAPNALRPNTAGVDDHFQMIDFARRDGYVYAFGTPNGRFGDAYLARVPPQRLLDQAAYQYWTGTTWQAGSSAIATPIVTGPVGELSVRYDPILHSWEMMTLDESRAAIVVRLSPQPTGPWSAPIPVATARQYPTLYGGFLHPDSKGADLYFTMSQYDRYNVSLMHATLPTSVPT
jgi:hypothetical protein